MTTQPVTALQSLIAGSISGMAGIVVCHPFDVLRTNIQIHPNLSVNQVMRSTFQTGFQGWYKGITGPFIAQALYKSIIFVTNTMTQRYLFQGQVNPWTIFIGGAIAGTINSFVVSPVEIVRTRQIMVKEKMQPAVSESSLFTVIKDIYSRNGWRGFWISMVPTVIRDGPGMGFYMVSFDLMKRYLLSHVHDRYLLSHVHDSSSSITPVPLWIRLLSGSAAGIAFWTWAIPVDTIKTIIESSNAKHFSWSDAMREMKGKGFGNLFRALPVAYLRGIPSAAVTLTAYELVIDQLTKIP